MAFDRNHTSTGMKLVIIIFAVVLVVSLMLPSLSALLSSSQAPQQAQEQNVATEQAIPQSASQIDDYYKPSIESIEKRLEQDPENVALLNDKANAYFDWAMSRSYLSVSDEDKAKTKEVFAQAVTVYDQVLAKASSNSASVDRAIAEYYSGEQEAAIKSLEDFTADAGANFAPAWANLAMFYEKIDKNKALETYNKALDLVGNGNESLKEFVNARKQALEAADTDSSDSGSEAQDAK